MASCGDEGKVSIFGLCDQTHDQVIEFNRPIKSIELDPNFSTTFSFVTGDNKVTLRSFVQYFLVMGKQNCIFDKS